MYLLCQQQISLYHQTYLQLSCIMCYFCNCKATGMRYSEIKEIIKDHKLRVTDCRIDVLGLFHEKQRAVSIKDLEENLPGYDRVTLYRTLNSFAENGLVHKIPDDSGFASYGLCHSTCTSTAHQHNHIHFKCNSCGTVECMDKEIQLPDYTLPGNYSSSEVDIIINGVCGKCND